MRYSIIYLASNFYIKLVGVCVYVCVCVCVCVGGWVGGWAGVGVGVRGETLWVGS